MLRFEAAKSGRYSHGKNDRVLKLTLAEENLTFYLTKKVGDFTCRKCKSCFSLDTQTGKFQVKKAFLDCNCLSLDKMDAPTSYLDFRREQLWADISPRLPQDQELADFQSINQIQDMLEAQKTCFER